MVSSEAGKHSKKMNQPTFNNAKTLTRYLGGEDKLGLSKGKIWFERIGDPHTRENQIYKAALSWSMMAGLSSTDRPGQLRRNPNLRTTILTEQCNAASTSNNSKGQLVQGEPVVASYAP
jgi:hypothetical protein